MDILTILVIVIANLASMMFGTWLGQKVVRGERIEAPNPIKAIKENKIKKEEQVEQNRMNTILENIENYNGSSFGQKDV